MWTQRTVTLDPRPRGIHLVTRELLAELPELSRVDAGLLHVFIRHTSASLTLNENASPDVRRDLNAWLDDAVPEGRDWEHSLEGPDDMPAHLRAALTQTQLSIPLVHGRLVLGTWQGIYLFEHRRRPHRRTLALHMIGE